LIDTLRNGRDPARQKWTPQSCNPEPNPLQHVARHPLGPYNGIQGSFTRVQVSLGRFSPVRPLEDLPEQIQAEVNGDTDIIGDETLVIKPACDDVEAVKEDDQAEEDQGRITSVGLEGGLECQFIPVDALCDQGLAELNVGNADRHPGEQSRDGGQVLEPLENGG